MEHWELEAREMVRNTVAAYAHAVDSGRFGEFLDLFAEDGVLEVAGEGTHKGRNAIHDFVTGVNVDLASASDVPFIRHFTANLHIEVDGPDVARARCYFLVVTGRGVDHWGRYRDRLVRQGDQFLFSHRRVRTDGGVPGSWFVSRGVARRDPPM
ncbi:MAG: nuclear transport factor 2 family protein [Acidimicrobiia bacterium]